MILKSGMRCFINSIFKGCDDKLKKSTGYFKLHRELFDKPIWTESTLEQRTILITLLSMASYKKKQWEWHGKTYEIEPGQFVTSLSSIQKKCGKKVSISHIRTSIEKLEKLNFLTNESTKQGRLITIVNWGLYQSDEEKSQTISPTAPQNIANDFATIKNKTLKNKRFNNKTYSENFELNNAIYDLIEARKLLKKAPTERAIELLLNKLEKLSSDPTEQIAIINQSIINGWSGVFPLKGNEAVKKTKNDMTVQKDRKYTEEELEEILLKRG